MGKMKETQLEMFEWDENLFQDVAEELLVEEDIMNAFDIHPDWNDLDVTYTVEYNDTMTPITLDLHYDKVNSAFEEAEVNEFLSGNYRAF